MAASTGELVGAPTIKLADAAQALYFLNNPLEGMSDAEKKDTIRDMFLNYRPAFKKAWKRYPELAAESLRELAKEGAYSDVSREIAEFIGTVPTLEKLKGDKEEYRKGSRRSLGVLGASYIVGMSAVLYSIYGDHGHQAVYWSIMLASLLVSAFSASKIKGYFYKRSDCDSQYVFRTEFEKDAGQK